MPDSTLLIIGAALVVLALLLVLLARSGRRPHGRPVVPEAHHADPLPEPGAVGTGLATDELAEGAAPEPEPIIVADDGPADPLTRMKGLGPKAEATLNALGVTRYAQIAAWTDADVARIDERMGAFRGRIVRDRWVEQAKLLAASDTTTYEATFGKLG